MTTLTPPAHGTARPIRSLLSIAVALLGAVIVGFAIPLLWLWIGAKIQGASGVTHMTKTTALAMFPGVAISYALLLRLVARLRARFAGQDAAPSPPRRYAWNRSMRDEPDPGSLPTPLERVFIVAAMLVSAVFTLWFFLWAQSPI